MSELCSFCCIAYTAENLKTIFNSQLNISLKLKDAFKIEIDFTKFTEICNECEEKLEISWNFYKQVSKVQNIHSNCIVKEEPIDDFLDTKVEITMEESNEALYEFADPENCNFASASFDNPSQKFSSVLIKEEYGGSKEIMVNRFAPPEASLEFFQFPSLFDPSKSSPFPKKRDRRSRGIHQKTISCITMPHVFGDEINFQKFFELPEVLENFNENPRSWSDYYWKCTECEESFNNVIEMNMHLTRSHRGKQHRGTCVHCHKETPNFGSFLNHIIEGHYRNLKFCCVICSEFHVSLIELYNHHQTAHKSLRILFCLYCGLNFSFGASLRDHMIKAHNRTENLQLFECDICGKTAKLKGVLIAHILRHNARTVPCELW